ncbi:hypothetical protein Q3V23_34785 [Streptomyces sp. VNUA116]|uniref:hypothetical protein n=1 Tax=Streptomyces sp. VNUA116 TaxID=3062449 RepID=UPI002674F781|nr:hypothetical protein [Streptomyces sp. VNUA116]WKU48813.1 hypothetical protein Q3V23_34785 [Streptomyces sp. VNUA116]
MSPDSGDIWHDNPFPLIPVARLGPSADLGDAPVEAADSGNASIRTPVLAELSDLVVDYLADRPAGGRRGRAIALVGRFGLGKSHALREVYATLAGQPDNVAVWIADEPVQDMGRMYRDRLRGPGDTPEGRRGFEELVRDYYAYVTANRVDAQGSDPRLGALDEVAAGLRDGSLDPGKVVSALRYDPAVIHTHLLGTLGEVTEHRRFAIALALLQEPPFTRMVWEWLTGGEPAEPLRERGITEAIGPSGGAGGPERSAAGIHRVFDALAVQGFLHGRVGRPYALLMDSLEKVLDWPDESRRAFVDAFERLIDIYTSRGGLLVFCVSPAGLRKLRPSVHERVVQLWPSGLDEQDTGRLVAAYVAAGGDSRAGAHRPAGPFGPEALRLLYELTEGVPREVLKTCRQAWQLSEEGEDRTVREVTAAKVLAAVRELHERVSRHQVAQEVHRALDLGQWRIATHDPVPARRASPPGTPEEVLYWLAPAPDACLAVVLTDSVLVADDAERVVAHVHSLRNAVRPQRFEALLVVRGHVSGPMQDRLGRMIGSRPLVYRQGDFAHSVDEALRQLDKRLTDGRQEQGLVRLGERVRRGLEEQSAQLAELRREMAEWAAERRPEEARPASARLPDRPGPQAAAADLPGPVRSRFQEALTVLDVITRDRVDRGAAEGPGGRAGAGSPAELGTVGCATVVRALTEKFRGSVSAWHRTAPPGAPAEDRLGELRRICREYEYAVEVLPVHLLGSAGPPHPRTAARTVEALAEEVWDALSEARSAP